MGCPKHAAEEVLYRQNDLFAEVSSGARELFTLLCVPSPVAVSCPIFAVCPTNAYRATREEDPNLHTPRPSFPHGAPSFSRSEIRFLPFFLSPPGRTGETFCFADFARATTPGTSCNRGKDINI